MKNTTAPYPYAVVAFIFIKIKLVKKCHANMNKIKDFTWEMSTL